MTTRQTSFRVSMTTRVAPLLLVLVLAGARPAMATETGEASDPGGSAASPPTLLHTPPSDAQPGAPLLLKAVLEGRTYLPVRDCVLALRLRLGTLEPFGGSEQTDVPLVSRFYSGGSTSVRGFAFQKLGPLDEDGDPLGGLSLAEGSAELRFPIWRRLSGVVFVDAGRVALDSSNIGGGDFYYSTGAGLRVRTPLGPLRLDYGFLLNPPSGIDRSRLYISVGHAF